MGSTTEIVPTLTDRYQTTVPEPVRRALKLNKRDRIRYTIFSDGSVQIGRCVDDEEADPVLGHFLVQRRRNEARLRTRGRRLSHLWQDAGPRPPAGRLSDLACRGRSRGGASAERTRSDMR